MAAIFNNGLTRWRSGFAARCLCSNVRENSANTDYPSGYSEFECYET
jgi:hypothetical protein